MTKKMNRCMHEAGRYIFVLLLSVSLILTSTSVSVQANENNKITIATMEDFEAFAAECYIDSWSTGKVIELKTDLDFTGRDVTIIPVFDGTFHGNGHSISGLEYEGSGYVTALFRYVEQNGVIDSLNVSGNISATDEKECVGGIVGINYGTIRNCSFSGTVNGSKTIGGIAAFNKNTGIIRKCTVSGSITGSYYTGGITGKN
ncbi:MAG: GLUG motif-containing protein, partial [Lachnospiraceae bacterium]